MEIRIAEPGDAEAIRSIYAPYVADTAITFEYDIPDVQEFQRRIENTLERYPYLVALEQGNVIGYAYAGPFRPRAAYQHSVEASIYVNRKQTGKGVGRILYTELEKILLRQNVYVMYACITATEREQDEHLTNKSILFHEHLGYTLAGRFFHCGYKFDKWYSMIWMEKRIGEQPDHPEAFLPYPDLLHKEKDV